MSLPCKWDVQMGKIIEFMESHKGMKALQWSIVGVIIVQVGTFLVMWGSLTTTVKSHDKTIDSICKRFDNVKIVGYAYAETGQDEKQK